MSEQKLTSEEREMIRQFVHKDLASLIERVIVHRLCLYAAEVKTILAEDRKKEEAANGTD